MLQCNEVIMKLGGYDTFKMVQFTMPYVREALNKSYNPSLGTLLIKEVAWVRGVLELNRHPPQA